MKAAAMLATLAAATALTPIPVAVANPECAPATVRLTSVRAVDTPADRPALGGRPARACSARLEAASSWALADCQAAS